MLINDKIGGETFGEFDDILRRQLTSPAALGDSKTNSEPLPHRQCITHGYQQLNRIQQQ